MIRAAVSLWLALLWLVPQPARALSERFAAPFYAYPTPGVATAAATADFNRDGRLDVATAVHGDPDFILQVRFGVANGGLGGPSIIASIPGTEPTALAAGDMNGDGLPDLVAARKWDGAIQVFLNRGGSWTTFPPSPVGPEPLDLAIGDLNRDGNLDVVAVSEVASALWVVLGNGDGTLRPPMEQAIPPGPCALAIGNPDLDTNPDVVVAYRGVSMISVFFGSGTGALGSRADLSLVGLSPAWDVAIGRFDSDPLPDLAAISPASGMVSIFRGAGGRDFFPPSPIFPAAGSVLAAADLNGDGSLDLACAGDVGGEVFLGDGAGEFAAPIPFKGGRGGAAILAGRLEGDTHADLIVPAMFGLHVLLGRGGGSFGEDASVPAGSSPRSVALGNLNGDGNPDAVISDEAAEGVQIILGDPGFQNPPAPTFWPAGGPVRSVALADLDGDADVDVVAALAMGPPGNVKVLRNDGIGGFELTTSLTAGGEPRAVVVRDVNEDGASDLLVPNGVEGTVSIILSDRRGGFQPAILLETGGVAAALVATNLIGDPHIDLAVVDESFNQVRLFAGDGLAGFTPSDVLGVSAPHAIVAGDWNQDGLQDLAASCATGVVATFLNGAGGLRSAGAFPAGPGPDAIAAADFDNDAQSDLIVSNPDENTITLLRGLTTGDFGPPEPLGTGAEPRGIAVADLDGDSDRDVVVATFGQPGLQVLRNQGAPDVPDLAPSLRYPPNPFVEAGGTLRFEVAAEDLNGDPITTLAASGLPAGAVFAANAANTSGTFSFSPTAAQLGDHPVTFLAANAAATSATIVIHVTESSAKMAGQLLWRTREGDAGVHVVGFRAANRFLESYQESLVLTVTFAGGASAPRGGATQAAQAPGRVTKGPIISYTGNTTLSEGDTFVIDVTASDADSLTTDTSGLPANGDATFATDAQPLVDAPAHVSASPGQPVTFHVGVSDPDGDPVSSLTADLSSLPAGHNASFMVSPTNLSGDFTWTPSAGVVGTFGVTFVAANALTGVAPVEIHVATSPASYWKLNGSGKDELGMSDLMAAGNPLFAPAHFGEGLNGDGSGTNGLRAPALAIHDIQGPRTIELWVDAGSGTGADQALVAAHDGAWDYSWLIGVSAIGRAWFRMQSLGSTADLQSFDPITGGGFRHVAVTSDGTTLTLYVDGAYQSSIVIPGPPCAVAGGDLLVGLGLGPFYPARAALLDEIRIWNTCRTQQQINQTMGSEIPQFSTTVGESAPVFRNALFQNAPNPFNPRTEIAFEMARPGRVRLGVYDVSGRLVRRLVNALLPAGRRHVVWSGTDDHGRAVASGIYFYRIDAPGYRASRRMALMR